MLTGASATVIIPTRDRPEQLRQALACMVLALPDDCTLVVVDQSRDQRTADIVAEIDRQNVRVIPDLPRGASAARNLGAAAADAELLLFTDDDCVVDADWVRTWCRQFAAHAETGVAFGSVVAPSYDAARGWVPAFAPTSRDPHTHGPEVFMKGSARVGMGANMAVRRAAWRAAGGFDEQLGAGAAFAGAEEIDLAFRIVRLGFQLQHVAEARVVHHLGFRPWAQATPQVLGYARGQAAMYTKHLRCGDMLAARLLVVDGWRRARATGANIVRRRRPVGVRQLRAYVGGLVASAAVPIDRSTRRYIDADRGRSADRLACSPVEAIP